jgi:hypothetical protein
MDFKGTITAGEVLQIVTLIVGFFAAYNRLSLQITKLEVKLDPIYKWWNRQVHLANDDKD